MRRNRIFTCLMFALIMSMLLGGCGNKEDKRETSEANEETAEVNKETTGVNEETVSQNPTVVENSENDFASMGAHTQIYQTRKNSAGELEYGLIAGTYELSEEHPVFGFECRLEDHLASDDVIFPSLIMVFYAGQPVEFSMDGGEYALTAVKDIRNREQIIMNLCLNTDKFSEMPKTGRLILVCMPEYNNTEWSPEHISFGCVKTDRDIYNTFSKDEKINMEKTEMLEMTSHKEITGIDRISQQDTNFMEYVVKGIDNKYYYMYYFHNDGTHEGEKITYILLDGKLINAGDGYYGFRWETNPDRKDDYWYIVHEIELPEMSAGEHILDAVTVNIENNYVVFPVTKSAGLKIICE